MAGLGRKEDGKERRTRGGRSTGRRLPLSQDSKEGDDRASERLAIGSVPIRRFQGNSEVSGAKTRYATVEFGSEFLNSEFPSQFTATKRGVIELPFSAGVLLVFLFVCVYAISVFLRKKIQTILD
jgi:hypothetical protein